MSVPRGSTVLLSYPKDANIPWFVTQRQDGWGGGGGSLNLEILRGGEAQAVLEIQVERGVKKPCLPLVGCGFFLE